MGQSKSKIDTLKDESKLPEQQRLWDPPRDTYAYYKASIPVDSSGAQWGKRPTVIPLLPRISIPLSQEAVSAQSIPDLPIIYNERNIDYFDQIFSKAVYPFALANFRNISPKIVMEFKRFAYSLDAYLESRNPVMTAEFILRCARAGPKGAKYLKKVRKYSFVKSCGNMWMKNPDDLANIPTYHRFEDIGDLFNYNYLPHWKTPSEEVDDFKWGFREISQDPQMLKEFREAVKIRLHSIHLRPEEIVREEMLLSELSGSRVVAPDGSRTDNWKSWKAASDHFETAQRCVLDLGPANIRDTIVNQQGTLKRIQWIDRQTRIILDHLDNHIHLIQKPRINKRISKVLESNWVFLNRDLKKEGITKPRNLLKIMLEELKLAFPDAHAYDYPSFFDSFSYTKDGELIKPIRGHGLGMANALTTLMQISIFDINLRCERLKTPLLEECDFLAINDDCIAGAKTEEILESFARRDEEILERLGLIHSPMKSFFSNYEFVLAEEYKSRMRRSLNEKESYIRTFMYLPLTAVNIVQAKQLVGHLPEKWDYLLGDYLTRYVHFWGYEFYRNEYKYPSKFGGWYSSRINGICLDLKVLEENGCGRDQMAAYNACRQKLYHRIRGGKDKKFLSPYRRIYGNITIPKEYGKQTYDLTEGEMNQLFFRGRLYPKILTKEFIGLARKRRKEFNKTPYKPIEKICMEIMSESPADFYPPDCSIEKFIESDWEKDTVNNAYSGRDPIISMLKKYNPDCITFDDNVIPEEFTINCGVSLENSKALTAKQREALANYINPPEGTRIPTGRIMQAMTDNPEFRDSFIHPRLISSLWRDHHGIDFRVPILKPGYRSKYIALRKEVYTRDLTFEEELLREKLSRMELRRYVILKDMGINLNSPDSLTSFNESLKDKWTIRLNSDGQDVITQVPHAKEAVGPSLIVVPGLEPDGPQYNSKIALPEIEDLALEDLETFGDEFEDESPEGEYLEDLEDILDPGGVYVLSSSMDDESSTDLAW